MLPANLARYARQIAFDKLGREGQERLLASRAAVLGLGALGSVIAEELCRAGVGFIRLIDRDVVEPGNLHRQFLYTEEDAREGLPKADAARRHLAGVNAGTVLEPVIADVNGSNIEEYIADTNLVLDGSDNFELRYLINEACHKLGLPWIYGGALGASGSVMNILAGGPCFRCLSPEVPAPGSYPTCNTAGALNMATALVASVEAAEAVKILTGSPSVSKRYLSIDLWENALDYINIQKNPDCPLCGKGRYDFLGKPPRAVSLSCQDAVQVFPNARAELDFDVLAASLEKLGSVKRSEDMLSFEDGGLAFNLFKDGRALIKGVQDEKAARSIYAEYIGL
jgi:adenylyltransferase/sulfurtransferase